MGRIRTLNTNTEKYTASELINKKKNLEILKFARSIETIPYKTNNFYIKNECIKQLCEISNNELCKYPDTFTKEIKWCWQDVGGKLMKLPILIDVKDKTINNNIKWIHQPSFYIDVFKNYKMMINLLITQATLNKKCYTCLDVPSTLDNGLTSEINLQNLDKCCIPNDVNFCDVLKNSLYPYGNFNNNNPNINYSLKRKLTLICDEKKLCPTYIYCKCKECNVNCKCCDYTVVFPYKNTFLSYKVSGCNNPELYNLLNNRGNNPNLTYEKYLERLNQEKHIEKNSIYLYSKYNHINI